MPQVKERVEAAAAGKRAAHRLPLGRFFSKEGTHPFEEVRWGTRKVTVRGTNGHIEERELEFPDFWSDNAASIAGSKYFRGRVGSEERESSVKQMISRVVSTIRGWGLQFGYFDTEEDANIFGDELTYILLHQKAAFNSPVWFNVGVEEKPQCSACQPYRALMSTPTGFIPIGEIVEKNLIGLPVYDSQGVTRVIAVKNNGVKNVYRVILRNGAYIEATGDHLVKAVDERRTEPRWVRVDELRLGMRMHLYPHREIMETSTLTAFGEDTRAPTVVDSSNVMTRLIPAAVDVSQKQAISEAALAGWLQSDGFVGQYIHTRNKSLIFEFITVTPEETAWVEGHLNVVLPDVHRKMRVMHTKHGTPITRIRLYGAVLRPFIEKYELLKRKTEIRVPKIIWNSSPRVITAYLQSVFQAEGYVSQRGNSVHMGCDTISKGWMEDLQILLYGLGIYSRLRRKKEKRSNRYDLWNLDISYGSERLKFASRIGFLSKDKKDRLTASLNNIENQKTVPDLREEEIIKIEKGSSEAVYDIQTLSGEYLSNNIAVHNCFLLAVEDNLRSILDWIYTEGLIFKGGSGSGVNLSPLRSVRETLSKGGHSSGPVSFMRGADAVAGMIASGGSTRRAAKMVVLNADHPDIMKFVRCKAEEEKKVRALIQAGYNMYDLNNPARNSIQYQNANNSVRVTDEFMQAVEHDEKWETRFVTTGETAEVYRARDLMKEIAKAAWECGDPGMQYDTTINRWHTNPNTGRITTSNPCSEYLSIDNSSCNLASINLLKYLNPDRTFAVRDFMHTVDTMILAQEIIVDGAGYPTEKIAQNTHDFRQLGLGYANLGAMLMTLGMPYDSDEARHGAAAITALMTGEAYRYSAEIARRMDPYQGYALNKEPQLNVIAMHRDAMNRVRELLVFDKKLYQAARKSWDDAVILSKRWGVRNAQASLLAPTGTIALMMSCDTTGVEPEFALVKHKQLVGGGMMKFVNTSIPEALRRLEYGEEEVKTIVDYIEKQGTAEGAPGLKDEHLPIFDCAVKPQNGTRSIHWQGHVKMVAAVQPFLSGAISKTFNMTYDTTAEEIMEAYIMGWKLGLKAFAVYRDGSKAAQPLVTASGLAGKDAKKQPVRRRLPATRPSETHKFSIAGHEGYLTYSMYEDGTLGETFITMSKQGSTLAGLLDVFAIAISIALQHGVPFKTLARQFIYGRFEPSGFTENPAIQAATSITDYIFRYLSLRFLKEDELEELGIKAPPKEVEAVEKKNEEIQVKKPWSGGNEAKQVVFADSVCRACGGMLIQTGSCKTCIQCGTSNGGC